MVNKELSYVDLEFLCCRRPGLQDGIYFGNPCRTAIYSRCKKKGHVKETFTVRRQSRGARQVQKGSERKALYVMVNMGKVGADSNGNADGESIPIKVQSAAIEHFTVLSQSSLRRIPP